MSLMAARKVEDGMAALTGKVAGNGTCSTWMPLPSLQLLSSGCRLNVPVDGTRTPLHPLSHCMYQRS